MVNHSLPLFQIPAEVWGVSRCRTEVDRKYSGFPFKGYIGSGQHNGGEWGITRYNGGCIRNGEWWQGQNRPLPKVAPGFEIIHVVSWGYRIVKKTS